MSYLDIVKRQTQPDAASARPEYRYGAPSTKGDTRSVISVLSAESAELPVLDAGAGSPALRHRVLLLGKEHGYPALSLGSYRVRKRTAKVGLFAGRGWWLHQTNYFGDTLLHRVIRQLEATP